MSSPLHNRKIKLIIFDLGGTTFQCQIENFNFINNTPDGAKIYSMCPDGVAIEETDEDWALQFRFFSDWRVGGISDFLMLHDGEDVAITVEHHPDIPAEHTVWDAVLRIKAPNVGGDIKVTERQEATMQCVAKPTYTRP